MKFGKSVMAAGLVASTQAASITIMLDVAKSDHIYEQVFWENFLLNLQRDTGNTSSSCYEGFADYKTVYAELEESLKDDASYYAGIEAKGQGSGSAAGYAMDKAEKYIDLSATVTNVVNQCDLMYYLVSVSKAVSSLSGLANQAINTYYRSEDTALFADVETALANDDTATLAAYTAEFVKDLLMTEIPDTSETASYQSVGNLM